MRAHVLGLPVDDVADDTGLAERLAALLDSGHANLVATPNAEMAVAVRGDETFRSVLRRAALAPPDSFGLVLATAWLTGKWVRRVPGPELLAVLLRVCEERGARVFLFGGRGTVARDAGRALVAAYPKLSVVGTESGLRGWGWRVPAHEVITRIRHARPDVLLVALGHGRQEKWLAHHLWSLPSVRIGIGVGGALDFYAGTVRRSPKALRAIGLEWFWRLLVQPWRLPRILTATVRFTWIAFWARFVPRMNPAW